MRALPVFVAALLLFAAAAGAADGLGSPSPAADADADAPPANALDPVSPFAQTTGNQTGPQQINVLDVEAGAERSNIDEQYVDLGSGIGLTTGATTDRLQTLSIIERVESAGTMDMRRARLKTALDNLDQEVDALDRRQDAAIAAYNRGEISSRDLLVTLVRISIAAEELTDRRVRLERLAEETPGYDSDRGRLASIGNRLGAFTGPVRAHAERVLRGEVGPHRFYVATGPESVVITTIIDDTYVREAYRGDLQNGAGDPIELEVALDIVATSYPVIWNTTREQTQVFGGGETYPVRIAHSRGDLTAFVDSNARVVYAEHQRRPLSTVVADSRIQRSSGGLRLVVNHTYPGAPIQIRTLDATGTPVDATVSMTAGPGGATRLGTAGDDGVFWTLSPNRPYTITVESGGENVSAVISPGFPPRVKAQPPSGNDTANTTATPTPTAAAMADVYQS